MKKPPDQIDPELQHHSMTAMLEVKKRSDRLMNYFLLSYFSGGIALAFYYDTWLVAFGVGGLSLLAYYSTRIALPDSDLYQYILSVVLGLFMAQYIYQMHGLFEMHFTAFIGSAILITYQNWKLQIPMAAVVVVHHGVFGYLQNAGYDKIYFTQLATFELGTFIIHILLSAVIFFTCGLWAYQLKRSSELRISKTVEVIRLQKEALHTANTQKEELERQLAVLLDKAVAQGKFEIASDVLHDIGNAVVGFGSYLTRITRSLEQDSSDNLQNLAGFFETQQPTMGAAIGEAKAEAVVTMLRGIAQTQKDNQKELRSSITEQLNIITHIQEILNIQRQYIAGQVTGERRPVNLRSIINDCMSMLFTSMDKNAIAVSMDFPEEQPVIKGDRTRLMQLILNVLKNSIEAMEIHAAVKAISLRMQRQDGLLMLQVRDSGSGFNEAIGCRLFERGFTTKPTGAGLGLYNCRTIVESHEGSLDITSEGLGKGALATIRFKI